MDPRDLPTEVAYRRERLLHYARKRRPRERQGRHRLPTLAGRPAARFVSFEASRRRRVVGRALLGACAVVALLAAVGALLALPGTGTETVLIDAWRALGLAVFGGLFALVARDPTGYSGVLELAIAHKLAVALTASIWRDTPDAFLVLAVDGALAAVLMVAYILLRADRAWSSVANQPPLGQRDAAGSRSVRPRPEKSREPSHGTGATAAQQAAAPVD
jgi:hypothetical protein